MVGRQVPELQTRPQDRRANPRDSNVHRERALDLFREMRGKVQEALDLLREKGGNECAIETLERALDLAPDWYREWGAYHAALVKELDAIRC